jgi:hypothetical protein
MYDVYWIFVNRKVNWAFQNLAQLAINQPDPVRFGNFLVASCTTSTMNYEIIGLLLNQLLDSQMNYSIIVLYLHNFCKIQIFSWHFSKSKLFHPPRPIVCDSAKWNFNLLEHKCVPANFKIQKIWNFLNLFCVCQQCQSLNVSIYKCVLEKWNLTIENCNTFFFSPPV